MVREPFSLAIEAARRGAIQCHWENGDVAGDQNDSAVGRRALVEVLNPNAGRT